MSYRDNSGKFISRAAWLASQAEQTPSNLADTITHLREAQTKEFQVMTRRIGEALDERVRFERAKSPNGSHVELRRVVNMFRHSPTFAAFMVAIDADPDQLFNRTRKNGTRSNLRGLRKVRQLVDYITGKTGAFERVSFALFASTIIAADKGIGWIASQEQELILSSEDVGSLPSEVQQAIRYYQHKHMTLEGDSRNQACQFRTTFANLNCYFFAREEFDETDYTLGVMVNMESPVIQYLRDRWQLAGV